MMSEYLEDRDDGADDAPGGKTWEYRISFELPRRAEIFSLTKYRQTGELSAARVQDNDVDRLPPVRPSVALEGYSDWDQERAYRTTETFFSPTSVQSMSHTVETIQQAMASPSLASLTNDSISALQRLVDSPSLAGLTSASMNALLQSMASVSIPDVNMVARQGLEALSAVARQQAAIHRASSAMMPSTDPPQSPVAASDVEPVADTASPETMAEIMSLCDSPETGDQARRILDRRPELVARVREIRDHALDEFADADVNLEPLKFDEWDPELSVTIYAYMPFDDFWRQRDEFDAWLDNRGWTDDPDLGVSAFYAGDHR